MTNSTKKPRYPANADAPKFTPEVWIKEGSKTEKKPKGLAVSSNCYQYAIAGSKPDGTNIVYDEISPNPGETQGEFGLRLINEAVTKKNVLRLSNVDGLEIASRQHDVLPPNKPGKYVVGIYVKNLATKKNPWGTVDYHFIRQDSDGGWSEKQGRQNTALVQRFAEPAADGGYITLTSSYGAGKNYKFAGYAYVPKTGIDAGVEAHLIPPILANLATGGDGCPYPDSFFDLIIANQTVSGQYTSIEYARDVGAAMKKHGIGEAVEAYEACLDKYVKTLKRVEAIVPTPNWP